MDLTTAEQKFKKSATVADQQKLDDARKAYRKELGGKPNNSSIPERLGESAARYHVVPEKFPGAEWVNLPSTSNGADRFDQLYRLADDGLLVVEAKVPSSDLGRRQGKGRHQGALVQQGTREYVETIIELMKERAAKSPQDGRIAHELEQALKDGKLRYVLVKAKDGSGSYAGATLQSFDIHQQGFVGWCRGAATGWVVGRWPAPGAVPAAPGTARIRPPRHGRHR
ncbi:hypothetical protein ACWCXX_26265 [Streptomyces sp. NPDC001732]